MLLVEHHNYYLDPKNSEDEESATLSLNKGSKPFKQLKMKGNYLISQLIEKIKIFIEKFRKAEFYVDDESITVFDELFINPHDNCLHFEFHEEFIDYLNERGHALTFIQNSDFDAIKRKNQVPIFLIMQSLRGLKQPFFTKKYITDILGVKGDKNKKLSVAFSKLKEKHVIEYEKEVCYFPGIPAAFSRFNIKNVDTDFVSKMEQDKSQKVRRTTSTPEKSEANQRNEPEAQPSKITANKPVSDSDNQSDTNVVCFAAFKQKKLTEKGKTADMKELIDFELDELDEAWVLGVSDENTVVYRTGNGALSVCGKTQIPRNVQVFTPEIMNHSKIKRFNFQ